MLNICLLVSLSVRLSVRLSISLIVDELDLHYYDVTLFSIFYFYFYCNYRFTNVSRLSGSGYATTGIESCVLRGHDEAS